MEFQLQHQSFPMNIKWVGLVALKRKRRDSGLSEKESLRPRRDQNCWHSKLTYIFSFYSCMRVSMGYTMKKVLDVGR